MVDQERASSRPDRSRLAFLLLAAGTVALGLATRRFRRSLPAAVGLYVGDVLWATMVYLLAAAIWPCASTRRLAIGAAVFALAIEVGQLHHAPWIDAIRDTRLGGLVLGFGFLWSDLACYAVGIALAVLIDRAITRPRGGAVVGIG
jgi:threonine/homoserine/homoserine lactone efflux protein